MYYFGGAGGVQMITILHYQVQPFLDCKQFSQCTHRQNVIPTYSSLTKGSIVYTEYQLHFEWYDDTNALDGWMDKKTKPLMEIKGCPTTCNSWCSKKSHAEKKTKCLSIKVFDFWSSDASKFKWYLSNLYHNAVTGKLANAHLNAFGIVNK